MDTTSPPPRILAPFDLAKSELQLAEHCRRRRRRRISRTRTPESQQPPDEATVIAGPAALRGPRRALRRSEVFARSRRHSRLCQAAFDQSGQTPIDLPAQFPDRLQSLTLLFAQSTGGRRQTAILRDCPKRQLASEQLVDHYSQREEIRAGIIVKGTEMRPAAEDKIAAAPAACRAMCTNLPGRSASTELKSSSSGMALGCHQDVRGLHRGRNPAAVGVCQRVHRQVGQPSGLRH